MYTYKTEILTVGTKWLSDKADANDIAMLDNLINERAADGWELVTYDYMATRYRFDYLTSTYDSKAGKVEKFTF